MVKQFIDNFKHIDEKISKIMKYGLIFCFAIAIFSSLLLVTYISLYANLLLFDIGIALFKFSLTLAVEFIICGYAVDIILR
ncbi:MAG: hypothetical protein HFJ49_00600 [Clostridia bacterium]|nr:hypothetical protein [Clostridia bacterium]